MVLSLPLARAPSSVFVQYLAGLAICLAVRFALPIPPQLAGSSHGIKDQPIHIEAAARDKAAAKVRIKWPNDVYAEVPYPAEVDDADGQTQRVGGFDRLGKFYRKVGGVLVTSHIAGGDMRIVVGCGINVSNILPTTCLQEVLYGYGHEHKLRSDRQNCQPRPQANAEEVENSKDANDEKTAKNTDDGKDASAASAAKGSPTASDSSKHCLSEEEMLGAFFAVFEHLWTHFLRHGWDPALARLYRSVWLHDDQLVRLGGQFAHPTHTQAHNVQGQGRDQGRQGPIGASKFAKQSEPNECQGEQVRIVGITNDYGMLRTVRPGSDITPRDALAWGSGTHPEVIDVMPDGNSFDMLQGLVRPK